MASLIDCPYCGRRTTDEFYIKGDATKVRPMATGDGTMDQWHDYVHVRDNVRGRIAEHWHHTGGCRQWLVVERDSMTHEVYAVAPASEWTASAPPAARPARKASAQKAPARKSAVRKAGGQRS